MERQERAGVRTMVRPSGGAAVPLDEGVLHVALLLAPAMTRDACSLHRDFQQLATLVVRAVERLNGCAVIGEVAGAVCPGSYDIHIGGYKVAGISQHRSIRGTLVHAFIDVCGDAIGRARWVEQLYREAGDETQRTAGLIPPIDPNVMTTIAQATGHDALTVAQFW
jgi:octanoyl-[GcvH]:protein N-octanoyltransferase